jgi:hypothetical protein
LVLHDSDAPHSSHSVMHYLNRHYPGRWLAQIRLVMVYAISWSSFSWLPLVGPWEVHFYAQKCKMWDELLNIIDVARATVHSMHGYFGRPGILSSTWLSYLLIVIVDLTATVV